MRRDALEGTEVNERRERVEDPDLDVAALEADGIGQRVAVDRGAGHRRMDEPDIDLRQTRLPGDRALCLHQRLALDGIDESLELGLGDRLVGLLALLAVGGREALYQLPGDPDDDLGRAEAGHLLGFLEGHRAVIDHRGDVGDRPGLHVGKALPLPTHAPDRAMTVGIDIEDERFRELRSDVEGSTGRESRSGVALPDAPPERHQVACSSRARNAARASARPSRRVPRPWAIAGRPPPRPSIAGIAAVTRSPAEMPRATRSSETVTNS